MRAFPSIAISEIATRVTGGAGGGFGALDDLCYTRTMGARRRQIQIRGLVSVMNRVRDQLRAGISAEREADFRATVRDAVRTVDNICRANRIKHQDLPTPSRKAYAYLSGLDLGDLPRPTRDSIVTENSVRISGILTTCRRYHRKLSDVVTSEPPPYKVTSPTIQHLTCTLQTEVSAIAGLCEDAGATPAALPVRSRRGYQWLNFLGDAHNLTRHLRALAVLAEAGTQARGAVPAPKIEIFPASVLYRTKVVNRAHQILVNEGFIDAPDQVLRALMRVALGQASDDGALRSIKTYAMSKDFINVRAAVEHTADTLSGDGKGHHHDLTAAFLRVNRSYFGGAVDAPRLIWNRRPTTRKMGHYDLTQDTVMISMSLDSADVPAYVVEFVVYHELLHKTMGTRLVNGRRHSHTAGFRKAERAFRQYSEAQTFLAAGNHTAT